MAKNISIKMSTMARTRSETDDEDASIQRWNRRGSRRRRSAKIGTIRASLCSPLPPLVQNRKWSIGTFYYHLSKRKLTIFSHEWNLCVLLGSVYNHGNQDKSITSLKWCSFHSQSRVIMLMLTISLQTAGPGTLYFKNILNLLKYE